MTREEVFAYTAGCYSGEPASCTFACPFRVDLRSVLKKAGRGRWNAAAKELSAALPFPAVVHALCPRPCEGACQRRTVLGEEPVAIGLIEAVCLRAGVKKERAAYTLPPLPQRAAVVGAGPAGLACALALGRKRYAVTVFERAEGWGGSLRAHPQFAAFDADFTQRFSSLEINFQYTTTVASLDELAEYDAIFLASGADGADFGLLAGWNADLGSTADPRVFLGGGLAGFSAVEGMAHALQAARAMESYLQSGNPAYAGEDWDRSRCTRYAPHPDEPPLPHVVPAGEAYTEEEAQAEAGRCMQCDCEACMGACELLQTYKKKPPRIAIDVAQDGQTRNSVSSACITRQTWSCSQCGRCAAQCGEGVDLQGLFALSRRDRVAGGAYPPAFHGYRLQELAHAAGPASLVKPAPGRTECRYAFFPGCRLGGANPAYVERSFAVLQETLGGAGILLNCCGVPALWAGEEARFQAHLERLRADWASIGRPTLVYACAACRRTLARFLPEIPLISLYELLAPAAGAPPFPELAVFDPCAGADLGEVKAAVRRLAAGSGIKPADYDSDGKCCGFGGHMELANPALYDAIVAHRCAGTEHPFLVWCVNCGEVFRARGKDCVHILDLVFGLSPGALPTLDEKKTNHLKAKEALLRMYWQEDFTAPQNPWDALEVALPPEVQEKMERRLIPLSDVKETIWRNEEAGEGFVNEAGDVVCRMAGPYLTCWVSYRRDGAIFRIADVYAHRMHIREDGEG